MKSEYTEEELEMICGNVNGTVDGRRVAATLLLIMRTVRAIDGYDIPSPTEDSDDQE